MSRPKDLTFKLPLTKTVVEVWSSDFQNFDIENKLIRITLDNTVSDILEVISLRSIEKGGNLHPRCMKVYFKNQEVLSYQPLSDFLQQEDFVNRLRIEINKDQMNFEANTIRPAFLNINLKLASGKTVSVREPLTTTIQSLKSYIVESIGLDESHIDHFEFNGGIQIHDESQTLGHLLDLDIAPLGELNFYVSLHSDFRINLSSPIENILRTNKIYSMLDTSILTIKYFIIDQYTGTKKIKPEDVKIIYFGRILTEATKLKDIIHSNTLLDNLTLHFVLKEPEDQLPSQGFWSDLRRGALFEFLPREPNPNFQAEVQRDERLREQLRSGNAPAVLPSESVLVQDDLIELNTSNSVNTEDDSIHHYVNGPPHLPVNGDLTGDSLDVVRLSDEELINVNQLNMSSTIFKITLNTIEGHKEVTLSSSQVIVNDSDPSNPYLMLSPSGFAKLQQLGVQINKPTIRIDDVFTPTNSSTEQVQSPDEQQTQFEREQIEEQNQREQQGLGININLGQINFTQINFTNLRSQVILPLYGILKYYLLYSILEETTLSNDWLKYGFMVLMTIHFFTRSSNSHIVGFVRSRVLPESFSNSIVTRFNNFQNSLKFRTVLFFQNIIQLSLPYYKKPLFIQIPINIFVNIISFIITFIPYISGLYIELIEERKRELRVFESLNNVNDQLHDINTDENVEDIEEQDGATGARAHYED